MDAIDEASRIPREHLRPAVNQSELYGTIPIDPIGPIGPTRFDPMPQSEGELDSPGASADDDDPKRASRGTAFDARGNGVDALD